MRRFIKKSERAITNIEYEELKEKIKKEYIKDKEMEEIAEKLKNDDQGDPYIQDLWENISSIYHFHLSPIFIIKYWDYLNLSEVGEKIRSYRDERYSNSRWTEKIDTELYVEIGEEGYLNLLSIMPELRRKEVIESIFQSYESSGFNIYANISFSSNFINYCKPYLDEDNFFQCISGFNHLTDEFVEENIEKMNQESIFVYRDFSDDFILNIKDKINEKGMETLIERKKLKTETVEKLFDRFTDEIVDLALMFQVFSDDFIQEHIDELKVELVMKYQPVTNKTIQMLVDKYGEKVIYLLRENWKSELSDDFIKANEKTFSLSNILIYHKVSDEYFMQTYKRFMATDFDYEDFYYELFCYQKFSKPILNFLLKSIKNDMNTKESFLYYQAPDEQFLLENAELIEWPTIFSRRNIKNLSNEFIIAHKDKIPWDWSDWNPRGNGDSLSSLDEEVLWELRDDLTKEHWSYVSKKCKLSPKFILEKAFHYIDLEALKDNRKINLNEMKKYNVFNGLSKGKVEDMG